MRLSRLQSIICQLDLRNIGLPAARPPNLFPPRTPLPRTDRPPNLSIRIHSLVSRLLFGVPSPFLPGCPSQGRRPARVPSLIAASSKASTRAGVSQVSRFVPSSGFRNLSTACSALDFAGLLHPATTSRVVPFRGFSRSTAVPTRRRSVPPCRCRPNTRRPKPAAMLERLDFEALLREPMRSLGLGFSLPLGRSPLRVPPPSGSAHPPWNRFPGSSARDVPVEVLP